MKSDPAPAMLISRLCGALAAHAVRPESGIMLELGVEVGASVARCPRTPPDAAKTPGLQIGISNRITRLEQPEHSCRLQLWIGPITAVPCRAKARPLRPRRSYFAPVSGGISSQAPSARTFRDLTPGACSCPPGIGGGAGYCPRVRKVYYDG